MGSTRPPVSRTSAGAKSGEGDTMMVPPRRLPVNTPPATYTPCDGPPKRSSRGGKPAVPSLETPTSTPRFQADRAQLVVRAELDGGHIASLRFARAGGFGERPPRQPRRCFSFAQVEPTTDAKLHDKRRGAQSRSIVDVPDLHHGITSSHGPPQEPLSPATGGFLAPNHRGQMLPSRCLWVNTI